MNDLIPTLQSALECGGDPEDIEEILNAVSALVKGPAEAWLLFKESGRTKKLYGVHATPDSAMKQADALINKGIVTKHNGIEWLQISNRRQDLTWLKPEVHISWKTDLYIEKWPVEERDA